MARNVRMGRPPLDGEQAATHVSVRIPSATVAALQERARLQDRHLAELIRDAVDDYLATCGRASVAS